MSSPNSEDAQNQPPSPKKRKTKSGEAAPDPSPTATAAVDPTTIANDLTTGALDLWKSKLVEEMEKKFVSREEHGALIATIANPPTELDVWKSKFVKEMETKFVSKEEHNLLKARFDHFTEALAPATQYALFETAIYEFVSKAIPLNWKQDEEKIKYALSFVCSSVLTTFLFPVEQKPFSWQGPWRRRIPDSLVLSLVRHGIAGLAVFIQSQDAHSLLTWDPKERNNVSHNGKYLDSVYSIPPQKERADEPSFSKKKQQVKETRKTYTDKASSVDIPPTIDDAVSHVVEALNEKGISVASDVKEKTIKGLKAV